MSDGLSKGLQPASADVIVRTCLNLASLQSKYHSLAMSA